MVSFLLALQFLTILPLKIKEVSEKKIANSMIFFPFVGLFLGLLLSGINWLLLILNFSSVVTNIILVVTLIVITGGMHLDGLSDSTDAFLSGKSKEEMLAIMRDPHIGVMGILSLISIILLKIGLLFSINSSSKITALLLMCILSRWSVVFSMFLFPYARRDGKAKIFIQGMNLKTLIFSSILVIIFSFAVWRTKGLLTLLIIAGCTYLSGKIIKRKIGGITGDTLGATIEIMELITLFTVCISSRGGIYE